jgi:hypothetical protein
VLVIGAEERVDATVFAETCRVPHGTSNAGEFRNSVKMWPVGWEALGPWGDDVARIEPIAGGVANDGWSVRVNGHLAVGRLGAGLEPTRG